MGEDCFVVFRLFSRFSAEGYASCLGCGNAFRLSLSDEFSLCLSHIAQKLQYDVRDQRSGQIPALPRIQQRHVQNDDLGFFLFCENSPLLQDLIIIPSEPVNALDDKGIARLDLFDEAAINRSVEVLSRNLICEYLLSTHTKFCQRDNLPVRVLLFGGYVIVKSVLTIFILFFLLSLFLMISAIK